MILPRIRGKTPKQTAYAEGLRKECLNATYEECRNAQDMLIQQTDKCAVELEGTDFTAPVIPNHILACILWEDAGKIIGELKKFKKNQEAGKEQSKGMTDMDAKNATENKPHWKAQKHMIRVGDLNTDYSYQRPLEQKRVNRYTKNWEDSLAKVVQVSQRSDGTYWVLDGNHTKHAFENVYGPEEKIECNVFEGMSYEDEASYYNRINNEQKKPKANDTLKAKRAAKDPETVAYFDALDRGGLTYTLGHERNAYQAHSDLMKVFRKTETGRFIAGIRAAVKAADGRGDFLVSGIFPGFVAAVANHPDLDVNKLVKIVRKKSIPQIKQFCVVYNENVSVGSTGNAWTKYERIFVKYATD